MSSVTNVICAYLGGTHVLEQVNACIPFNAGRLVHVQDPKLPDCWFCNGKTLEVDIAIGAFNYLDLAFWVQSLREVDWKAQGCYFVQLMAMGTDDWGFGIIDIWNDPENGGGPFDPARLVLEDDDEDGA